jgi:predicted Zn-dependent protease
MIKGNPQDRVDLNSVSEIGEGILHSVDKVGRIVTSVSDKEEMEIGDKINNEIAKNRVAEWVKDTPLDKYINDVGNKVAENVKRKDIKYKFHIIEGFYPNAFSLPGGHVYVTVGLLAVLRSEAELAAVLGHEITHIDAKHCIGVIQYKIKTEKILGSTLETFADIGYQLFLRPGFSEVQETEADVGSTYLLYKAGYHPMAIAHAFERIDKAALSKGYSNNSITPIGDTIKATAGMIGRYFASHPVAVERIDKIKRYINDHKLIGENSRFYIGEKNYEERISYKEKRFKDEFKKDYVVSEEKKEEASSKKEEKVAAPEDKEKWLNEVYTTNGRIAVGMPVEELEKTLPKKSQAFKYDTRIGYKDISVYEFENNGKISVVGLWIELEAGKIKRIRLVM